MSEASVPSQAAAAGKIESAGLPPELVPAQADAEALDQVYGQGVDAATGAPGVMEYLRDTLLYSLLGFFEWLGEASDLFSWLRWQWVEALLALLLVALLLLLALRLLRRWLAARKPALGADGEVQVLAPGPAESAPSDWAETLRRSLEAGDAAAALEALWWWLATALGARGGSHNADPSWTTRELLVRAGRTDLRRPARRLDHMIYGPGEPSTGEVAELWDSLRSLVPSGRGEEGETP